MAHVFYRRKKFFGHPLELNVNQYEYIGKITADNPGDAFRAMNHVDDSEVEAQLKALGVRSMSVDDIVAMDSGVWLCAMVGWRNLALKQEAKSFVLQLSALAG